MVGVSPQGALQGAMSKLEHSQKSPGEQKHPHRMEKKRSIAQQKKGKGNRKRSLPWGCKRFWATGIAIKKTRMPPGTGPLGSKDPELRVLTMEINKGTQRGGGEQIRPGKKSRERNVGSRERQQTWVSTSGERGGRAGRPQP